MKKIGSFLVLLAAGLGLSPAQAAENFVTPRLAGVTEGTAAGLLPSPGLYFGTTLVWMQTNQYDGSGNKLGASSGVGAAAPALLWVPGIKILGADYGAAIIQPFDTVHSKAANGTTNAQTGLFDTVIIPAQLSWALSKEFHVKGGFGVYIPDGDSKAPAGTLMANSIGYWAFEPTLGMSYLTDGWNLSAELAYDDNLKNQSTNYQSGDVFTADWSASKILGRWKMGVGGYYQAQVSDDTINGVTVAATPTAGAGDRYEKAALGPILGYNFGNVSLDGWYNHDVYAQNAMGGDEFWMRISFQIF